MRRKIILLFLILILLAGGSFLFKKYAERREVFRIEDDLERLSDFVVENIPEKGRIIKSKKGDFSLVLPSDWKLKYELEEFQEKSLIDLKYFVGHVEILSPKLFEASSRGEENLRQSEGCLIDISFYEELKSFEEIEEEIRENNQYFEKKPEEVFEIIKIGDKEALKAETGYDLGYWAGVYLPLEERIYILHLFSDQNNKEECYSEFSEILQTIII